MVEQEVVNREAHVLQADALVREIIATRREVEQWSKKQKNEMLEAKRDFETRSNDHARQTTEGQRKRAQLQEEHHKLSAKSHDQENKVNAQQVEIEVLQSEKGKKEPVLRDLFEQNRQKDELLKHLTSESDHQKTSLTQQLSELKQGMAMYERLGLTFQQNDTEKIIVRFTQIDRNDPQRVFSFRIHMESHTDSFLVDDCVPFVQALPDLADELNKTADFSLFIRSMRREFKNLT